MPTVTGDSGGGWMFIIAMSLLAGFVSLLISLGGNLSTKAVNQYFNPSPKLIERFISAPVASVNGENALLTNGHIINSYWCSKRAGTLVTFAQPGDRFVIQTEKVQGEGIQECATKIVFPSTPPSN